MKPAKLLRAVRGDGRLRASIIGRMAARGEWRDIFTDAQKFILRIISYREPRVRPHRQNIILRVRAHAGA